MTEYYFRIRDKPRSKEFHLKVWRAKKYLESIGFKFLGASPWDPLDEDEHDP